MSDLYLDLGNTRAKWFYPLMLKQGHFSYGENSHILGELTFLKNSFPDVTRVILSSVLSEGRLLVFVRLLHEGFGLPIAQCEVHAHALGVTCAYSDLQRLGVDRWLAVVASWDKVRGACVVVDAGTAATIDFLDENGVHRGGYIVAGLTLAVDSLLARTSNIRPERSGSQQLDLHPGCNTAEAVYNGAAMSLASLIERSLAEARKVCPNAKLILAGGDARSVGAVLQVEFDIDQDLVFKGMSLYESADLLTDVSV